MKLTNKTGGEGILSEFIGEITKELDNLAGFDTSDEWSLFHYIIIDQNSLHEHCLPIRVYGGTLGGVLFDENKVITKIVIDTEYVVSTYQPNVNEIINEKFIGQTLEW